MSSQVYKILNIRKKVSVFEKGIGSLLPEAYKKFYREWLLTEPTAVNYIPEEGRWKRDEVTGEVFPIQNVAIPYIYPKEYNEQLWGGDAVVQGFQLRDKHKRRVPHFWVPSLKRTVIYSEVLDKYVSVIVTDRALQLIHTHYGFDHYILKTPACDLKSLLPITFKRKILEDLHKGCPAYEDRPETQKEICNRYKEYLSVYTPEEIEWYGYTFLQACKKLQNKMDAEKKITPLKHTYRLQLIEKIKAAEAQESSKESLAIGDTGSWLQKINPFGKKHET